MRITLALTALFALACGGGAPAPTETPPAAPPPLTPPPVAPPPVVVGTDPAGAVSLPPPLIDEIARIRGHFDAVTDLAAFAAVHTESAQLAQHLAEALQPQHEKRMEQGGKFGDFAWLYPALPGLRETYEAEGTAVIFVYDPESWTTLANKTADPGDDRVVELLIATYGSANVGSWEAWQERNWDYGGCLSLGDGQLVDILKRTDAAKDVAPFAAMVADLRKAALDAVLADQAEFPRCDVETTQPTADTVLDAEVARILAEVKLTPEEKSAVEARRPMLKGELFKGG